MGNYESVDENDGILAWCRDVRRELAICNYSGVETACQRTRGVSHQQCTGIFV